MSRAKTCIYGNACQSEAITRMNKYNDIWAPCYLIREVVSYAFWHISYTPFLTGMHGCEFNDTIYRAQNKALHPCNKNYKW